MSKADIIRQLQAYKKNPDIFKEISPTQLAELILPVLQAVGTIDQMIKEGRLDGKTPEADKDYLALVTAQRGIQEALNRYVSNTDAQIATKIDSIEQLIKDRLAGLSDGNDGIVTDAEIERAAQIAYSLIELPNFDELVATKITASPTSIRDGLELLQGEERLDVSAIKGIDELISDLNQRLGYVATAGGLSRNAVLKLIEENGGSSGGGLSVLIPDESPNGVLTTFTFDDSPVQIIYDFGPLIEDPVNGFTVTGSGPYSVTVPIPPSNFIQGFK